jgi:hypothetical protein
MAERGRASRSRKDNVSGRFEFVGLEGEEQPRLRMEAVSPTGERKEIRLSDSFVDQVPQQGLYRLPESVYDQYDVAAFALEIGP